jgi:CDP-diacylglycerol---serine O-phosphatidyltransferase
VDQDLPDLDSVERRRRGRLLFRHRKIPVRMIAPNFFTLLALCAGITAIRMAIEQRYDMAVALVVLAGLLDGVDGRLARALKAQSKFGAELDSLADFVSFGVAPAIIVYTWGLGPLRGLGWIAVLVFACGMGLRLARFNAMIDVEKPKWQSNYFTGMPAPAGAIMVLLPLYLDGVGLSWMRDYPATTALYTLAMAFLLVSTIPTFSGKLLGERVKREWVMPILVGVAGLIGLLVTYPYPTLAVFVIAYLAMVPLSYRRYHAKLAEPAAAPFDVDAQVPAGAPPPAGSTTAQSGTVPPLQPGHTKH